MICGIHAGPPCRSLAAIGGMLVPASIFVAINLAGGHPENLVGWAVPTATDIAFALAVLAVLSTHLPTALRTFLLTLAVVDDLLAIIVIAVFYTDHLAPGPLALALIPGGLFALAVQRGFGRWWLLVPLAVATWALVHASGVHATVAGVLLGFTVPVLGRHASAEDFEHILRPLSAGIAVPVFAFFAAGVTVGGWTGLGDAAAASGHDWEWSLAWCSASRSGCSAPRSCWPNSPTRISTRTWRGATCSACHCWPASALPCRY